MKKIFYPAVIPCLIEPAPYLIRGKQSHFCSANLPARGGSAFGMIGSLFIFIQYLLYITDEKIVAPEFIRG